VFRQMQQSDHVGRLRQSAVPIKTMPPVKGNVTEAGEEAPHSGRSFAVDAPGRCASSARAVARAGGPRAAGGLGAAGHGAAGHGAGGLGSPACGLVQRESRPVTGLLPRAGALRAGGKEVRSARYCAALSSAPLRVDADRDRAREGSLVHGTLDLPA